MQQAGKDFYDLVVASKSYHYIVLKVSLRLFSSCLINILNL